MYYISVDIDGWIVGDCYSTVDLSLLFCLGILKSTLYDKQRSYEAGSDLVTCVYMDTTCKCYR